MARVRAQLIHGFPDVTRVSIHFVNEWNIDLLMHLCDATAWPHLDTLTIEYFYDTEEATISSTLCSVIAARPTIHHLCLSRRIFPDDPPELLDYTDEERPRFAWLREHVHFEDWIICAKCNAFCDRVDSRPREHECELEN
jgi:hypothetical protein